MRMIDADALVDDLMERHCKECNKRRGIKNGKYRIIYEIGEVPCRACEVDDVKAELEEAPTIEPKRNKGRWVERNPQNSDKCRLIECDQCGFSHIVGFNVPYEHWIENRNFCERCGADMRGEDDDIPMEYFESGGI